MHINTTSPRVRFAAATLMVAAMSVLGSCDTFNPFNPIAAVDVLEVGFTGQSTSSTGGTSGEVANSSAGIIQNVPADQNGRPTGTGQLVYTRLDPIVTLRNRPSAPEVRFREVTVIFDIPGLQIPQRTFLFQFLLPQGAAQTGGNLSNTTGVPKTIPIISIFANELISAVYPGDQAPIVRGGSARVFLKGTDSNNHEIIVEFTTPLEFNIKLTTSGTASATPSTAPVGTPTPATSPVAGASSQPASPSPATSAVPSVSPSP